jgi:hypothetical protein
MKEKNNTVVVNGPFASFDYATLYPHTFSGVRLRKLGVKLNRKLKSRHLWNITGKNTND